MPSIEEIENDPLWIVGHVTWTPPSEIIFGEHSGVPDRYTFIVDGRISYALQNEAGTLKDFYLWARRGKIYHIVIIPQYRRLIPFSQMYADGPSTSIDLIVP